MKDNTCELRQETINKILALIKSQYDGVVEITGRFTVSLLKSTISEVEGKCMDSKLKIFIE